MSFKCIIAGTENGTGDHMQFASSANAAVQTIEQEKRSSGKRTRSLFQQLYTDMRWNKNITFSWCPLLCTGSDAAAKLCVIIIIIISIIIIVIIIIIIITF